MIPQLLCWMRCCLHCCSASVNLDARCIFIAGMIIVSLSAAKGKLFGKNKKRLIFSKLLRTAQPEAGEQMFRDALARTPSNGWGQRGLMGSSSGAATGPHWQRRASVSRPPG
jgi:hypothetical protein